MDKEVVGRIAHVAHVVEVAVTHTVEVAVTQDKVDTGFVQGTDPEAYCLDVETHPELVK